MHDHAATTSPHRVPYALLMLALLVAVVAEAAGGGAWTAALAGFVGPDVALLLGIGRGLERGRLHPRAVPLYNALHVFWGPAAVALLATTGTLGTGFLVLALAWGAHVAMDRAAGYGLRTREGFQRWAS
jgi:hypothetical protein